MSDPTPIHRGLWSTVIEYIHDFPGFVVCEFYDLHGTLHQIIEKVPVLTSLEIDEASILPLQLTIPGIILEQAWVNGQLCMRFGIAQPYLIASTEGITEFWVLATQVE